MLIIHKYNINLILMNYRIINYSNNCYLNVILQILLNTFTKDIVLPNLTLIKKIINDKKYNIICPKTVLNQLKNKMNITIQNDAQEALIQYIDTDDKLQTFFDGKIKTSMKCLECNTIRNCEEGFITFNIYSDSLKDSIENTLNNERIILECDKCKKKTLTFKRVSLNKLPKILIFHNIMKLDINIPTKICLDDKRYVLNGIVNHIGNSFDSGHYIYLDIPNKQIFDDTNIHDLKNIPKKNNYLIIYNKI